MVNEITIPALPCASINETLEFYVTLGFEITYQQERPNTYACVRRGGIELHFFSMKRYEPANSYSTCIVLVQDVDGLYQEFIDRLSQKYEKKLIAGIPRMTALRDKSGGRGFNVIDPGGNWIRFSQLGGTTAVEEKEETAEKDATTKLSRATHAARVLADFKSDYAAAAKMLDKAMAEEEAASAVQKVQALVLRAEFALNLGDLTVAKSHLNQVRLIPLDDGECAALKDELERANDLQQLLS